MDFLGRKHFASINCMIVAGASYRIFYVDPTWPGTEHDSMVFKKSKLHELLESGYRPFEGALLAADSAYEVN